MLLNKIKSVLKLFIRPKQFAQGATLPVRAKMAKLFTYSRYSHYRKRRQLLTELNSTLKPLPEQTGFRQLDDLDPKVVDAALAAGRELIKKTDWKKLEEVAEKKYLIYFSPMEDLSKNSPILKFALHQPLLRMIGNYLGMLPVLENIMIWYSPNAANVPGGSQYYHLDAQDVRTLQVFLFLEDVTEDHGPLTLIQADASERLAAEITYKKSGATKRLDDELVAQRVKSNEIHKLVGKAGNVFIADTDRCFHYGSRQATRPRYIMVFQYYTPFAFALPWRWWTKLPYAKIPTLAQFNHLERLVLGSPR